jgi:hypothetical protein
VFSASSEGHLASPSAQNRLAATFANGGKMSEVLVRFTIPVRGDDGVLYRAQACGGPAGDGLWEGWIEFMTADGQATRSPRETEQPNRDTLMYWAEGLTDTYLQGALSRAITPRVIPIPRAEGIASSIFDGPARGRPVMDNGGARAVLDPFATYAQGEAILRRQLSALSRDHVVAIVKAYRLDIPLSQDTLTDSGLVDAVVSTVRRHSTPAAAPAQRGAEQRPAPGR